MIGLILLAVAGLAFAVTAQRLDRWSIGAPIVFLVVGVLLGPGVTDLLTVPVSGEPVKLVTEVALVLLLFTDASAVSITKVERDAFVPVRLLFIGLPLTVGLGALLAHAVLPGITWAMAALIATILSPTDAALSVPVVSDRAVPIRVRRALNIESGLNDGIATPVVVLLIAVVAGHDASGHGQTSGALRSIAIALLVAVVVGVAGGRLVDWAGSRGMMTVLSGQLAVLVLALLAYAVALQIGGNGFVSAFVAGLIFGTVTRHERPESAEFTETTGLFLSFVVWALFGAALLGPMLTRPLQPGPILLALLLLTVGRILPVRLAMAGSRWHRSTVAFVGWFGPRGLASVVFLLIAAEELHLDSLDLPLVQAATWTIGLSVLLHGLTARPLVARYARAVVAAPDAPESAPIPQPRFRRRSLVQQ